tara:strand:- start:191179 stop:191778 length:600 start_codon:yes stop_codon:yes gene_type:complete
VALFTLLFLLRKYTYELPKGLVKGVILGLLFSILSDLFFLFRVDFNKWFIIGTFLFSILAMYSYSYGFQHTKIKFLAIKDLKSITLINLFLSLLIVVFPISIFIIEDLELWQYPAILYQLLLWILISQGLKRQDYVNEPSYYIVLTGIVLYSITTMLITLQNFSHGHFDFYDLSVLTYFISQYLLVVGSIAQKNQISLS